MSQPDYQSYLNEAWGWPNEIVGPAFSGASNIVIGANPPFSVNTFLMFRPKFGGASLALSGTLTPNSPDVTLGAAITALAPGQLIGGNGIPNGTTILSVSGTNLILSANATIAGPQIMTVWPAPFVPLAVMLAYIYLASASLVQARWQELWPEAMGLYVAHFCTLWLQSEGNPISTPGAAAVSGLQQGIAVSKGVGPISKGMQAVPGLEAWGAWNLTQYGVQLATFAKVVGMGSMYVY